MNQTKNWKVDWCENKTSAKGASYMKATLTDETGAQHENVTIFSSFPNFSNIRPGEKISGFLKVNDYKGQTTYSLDVERTQGWGRQTNVKQAAVAAAMEKKQENIEKTLDRKDESYKISSTFRDATLLTVAQLQGNGSGLEQYKTVWITWRDWLWKNHDKDSLDMPPF